MNQKIERILANVQKPGRYVGGELNAVIKDKADVDVRFAFCFPDVYEVGMSHWGMKILYSVLNEQPDIWCERVFAPWVDMEEEMRKHDIPLFALESGDSVAEFDFIGFTLQYELSYTNILNMLNLAGIPDKGTGTEQIYFILWLRVVLVPATLNLWQILSICSLLEKVRKYDLEVIRLYQACKKEGKSKEEFLQKAAQIQGVYVPSLYSVTYHDDGTIKEMIPHAAAPKTVRKRLELDMDKAYFPEKFVVPSIEIVA